MDYKVFYRKYRPSNFDELVGQDSIREILVNSIKTGRIAHAYIFTGPRGTGKTSTAKIFAKTLNCISPVDGVSCNNCEACVNYTESADIIEIDAASNNGVEEIRTLRDSVKIAPYSSKYKVYIIDEVHMLSNSAWNAFLKTLEEPPSHVIFILATTEINKIPETVMSRCQRFDFSKIPSNKMKNHLLNICKLENVNIEDDALDEIIKLSNGCLRDALSYLDKVSKFGDKITISLVQDNFGSISVSTLDNLYSSIKDNNRENISSIIDSVANLGLTPLNFIGEFVDYLLNKLLSNKIYSYDDIIQLKDLIFKLNKITSNFNSIVNPFTLIKVELITLNYFPGNNNVDISQEIKEECKEIVENSENKVKVIESVENNVNFTKNEKKSVENVIVNNFSKVDVEKVKLTRINNSFVNVSKECKIKFTSLWKEFIDKLSIESQYQLLGYIENSNIEVVSPTNVLFSLKSESEAIIFNENLMSIENSFNEHNKTDYKFYALSNDEWISEKQKFISNKNKVYEYIEEKNDDKIVDSVKSFGLAEDIFGNDVIEVK